jgi:hypothetical protein
VLRDVLQSADADFHPHDAYVRIVVDGRFRGSAWYRFSDTLVKANLVEQRRSASGISTICKF